MDQEDITSQIKAACSLPLYHKQNLTVTAQGTPAQHPSLNNMSAQCNQMDCTEDTGSVEIEDILSNGTCKVGDGDDTEGDRLALSNDSMSEFSNNDLSLPEVCISSNSNSFEDDMNYEVQQAYRIFTGFLLDKHKGITNPFLHPIGHQEAQHGIGGVRSRGHAQLKQSMCLKRIEEKFINQEYETITEFVADFRLMLENCYRYHGVDHWISKQAQKLEVMLEQKLTLLSRTLREKTTLAVTSKGRFGAEEERASGGTSTRRRLAPRSLTTMTVVGHESVMVQALRQEEQQRAKDEKRQRELEKKEAEEMSAKEVEEWEQSLLSQASPHTVDTLWELPAIGHFLCLAQTALNLPEIVFFELERCLLMPRCSPLLSKIMSSLLSPSQRRATLHRRPALPYRRWESELRQRVMGWYRAIGASSDQPNRAEQLGLCHQFFCILGQVSPLEEKPFHLLPFYQRVWLLKGLCDHVYETQKDVQDAVLSQPIHECRESILGYDSKENAYIHFPHFCGADLRIYCQSPSTPPAFPFPSVWVKMVDKGHGTEGEESSGIKDESTKSDRTCFGVSMDTGGSEDFGSAKTQTLDIFKGGNWDVEEEKQRIKLWSLKQEEGTGSESGSSNGDSCDDSKQDLKINNNPISFSHTSPTGGNAAQMNLKEEPSESEHQSKQFTIKQEQGFSLNSNRTIKAETQEPCLNVGEHSYTGRSPARLVSQSPTKMAVLKMEDGSLSQGRQSSSCLECCKSKNSNIKSEDHNCNCNTLGLPAQLSSESVQNSSEERVNDKIWTKKKKRKKKRGREQLLRVKGEHRQLQHVDRMRLSPAKAAKSTERRVAPNVKKKDKKKKHKSGKKLESSKKCKEDPPVEPSFKLVCTSLEELRELINKTEDELDDLESTKKRLGRWYYRREAVKDLHSTLIRLLNELSPWEPKLVKAFQRNRLRLKKEFDDFRKHPEYNNFVREECISSSSSDDDEDKGLGNEMCSLSDHHRRSEEEDLEHVVPRGLWSEAANKEFEAESSREQKVTSLPPAHLHPLASAEKGISVLPRIHIGSNNTISTVESGSQLKSEMTSSGQSRDSNSACAASVLTQASLSPRPSILHPTTGLPKGYTPIPTLLAKSVGNKVTLMKRPADYPGANNMERRRKGSLVSLPTSAVTTTKPSKAQISSSSSLQAQGLQQMEVVRQPGMAMVTAAIPKLPQAKPTQTVPKSPVQVVYKMPERVGHLVRTDSSPVKISVHPAVDQNTREKIMQQVVILPSNLLIHKTEENTSSSQQQQPKAITVPVSKVASPICMSTNVPGFTIPENRIPVQQVAPLTDASTVRTPSPSVSPHLQQGAMSTTVFKGTQVSSPQASTIEGLMPSPSHTETAKTTDPKQELKTVCIRDSQSILVTTRGGNTGIVKVQTSSEQNAPGSLTSSPVITISPQFKAFLVSKTSATLSPSAPSQASPCAAPAITTISLAQPLKQVSSVLMSPSTVTSPLLPAVTGSIPVAGPGNQTASTTACLSHGSNNSIGKTVAAKTGQLAHTAPGSHFPASLIKSTVPSLCSSGVPQVITQAEVITKAGVKRASSDDRSQVTKFILVTPSSSTTSNVALSKGTLSATKPLPSSRVMFISQPSATLPTTTVGSIPKQVMAKGPAGLPLSTSLPNQALKTGISPGQAAGRPTGVTSETFSSVRNVTLPTGTQIQLSGKTTTIGQTIGALHSPSKSTPVSIIDAARPPVIITEVAPVTSSTTITSCLAQLASCTSVTTTSPLKKAPSFTKTSQPVSLPSTSTAVTLSVGSLIKKEFVLPLNMLSNNSTAQVTTTVQSGPAQTSVPNLYCPSPSKIQSGIGEKTTPSLTACQVAFNKTQTPVSSPAKSNSQFSNSASGTIQQRIVINTSTPLAAGTQILLNNTRFVVPPQGLGPGSHVLIISSPTPVQVPTASATSKRASVPPQEASQVAVAPQAPVLPQLPARLPGVPAVSSPFVSSPTTVVPSLLATSPNVTSVRLTGTSSLGSTVLPSKSNVMPTLPRMLTTQAGNLTSAPIDTPSLVSPSPSFGSMPALVSPVVTSAPTLGAALATVGLTGGRPKQTECLSTTSSAVGPHLSTGSTATSSIGSVLPNPSVPITLSSGTAPVVAGFTPALRSSLPAQHVVPVTAPGLVIQPQQTAVGVAAPSTALSQILDTTSFRKTVPQPVLPGTRTQVLPTVAVPPIISAVARMQTLPIATVTPIGSTVNTFETAPVVTALSSSGTVKITAAQPITSLKTSNTICQSLVLTNQALEKHSLQTSSLGMHNNVASKLLISPDGAVLNTVQCQVKPAELTTCPKPRDALVVSPHSSSGALHPHDSSLQASPADRKCTN